MEPGRHATNFSKPDGREILISLKQELDRLGVKREGDIFDFTSLSNAVAVELFGLLSRTNLFVFHGSNSERPYAKLIAQQANDASKESGNKRAVYVTSDPRIAITYAVINQGYLRENLKSYTHGYEVDNESFVFKASPNLYRLFVESDPHLFADGYVYILDRSKFILAGGSSNEYYSEEDQAAAAIFRVSQRLKEHLFVVGRGRADNVVPFSAEEDGPA
jgi:hypothetical protein